MTNTFSEAVRSVFSCLINTLKLRLLKETYDPKHFGNSIIELRGDTIWIRVVRDRGQVFVDIASPVDPDNWYDLERVLEAVGSKTETPMSPDSPETLELSAKLIERHLDAIQAGLSIPNYHRTKETLERIVQAYVARLLSH